MNDDPTNMAAHDARLRRFAPRDGACALLVIVIGMAAFWPFLFTRQALYWGDIELYFAPMQTFLHRSLAQGIVPLWNPYILCGEPFVGDPQTWPLYPSTLLAGVVPAWQFLTIIAATHLVLGGLFCYCFLRGENVCHRPGSVLGAVCFMLGGYFVTKTQFPNMAQAIAWAPAVLWGAGRLARAPGFWASLWLGVVLGLQLLAAHAQITLLTGYLALLYALFVAWPRLRGRERSEISRIALLGVAALALACCLDGGELLPVLEVWKHSDRQTLTLATANRFVLRPEHIAGLFAPNAFGSPFDGNYRGGGNYWEPACYLGAAPCLLAFGEIVVGCARRNRETVFWAGVFVASLWLATGRSGGLYWLAFHLAPGVKAFHDPARMLLGAALSGAVLAGRGADRLLVHTANRGWRKAGRLGIAAGLIILTGIDLAYFERRAYPLMPLARIDAAVQEGREQAVDLAAPGSRVLYPPDNKATWKYFADYGDYRQGDSRYMSALLATHTTDTGMLLGLADAGGYEPEPPLGAVRRYIEVYNAHVQERGDGALDALAVDSLIAFEPGATPGAASGYFASHRMRIWRNPERELMTRARLADGRYLQVADVSPDEVVVVIPAGAAGEVLHVADTDAPGWTAAMVSDDGRTVVMPIARAGNGLREATLPSSASAGGRFVLRYEPSAWRIGLFLTLLAAGFVSGCVVFAVLSGVRTGRA